MAGATGALVATPNRNCEQRQREPSYPALFWPTVSCCVQDNTCSPDLWHSLWALLLALGQVVLAIQPQVVVISVKQGLSCVRNSREGRTSVTSIHQFSGIFFSEAFFSGVASPCLKQSNNRVIY